MIFVAYCKDKPGMLETRMSTRPTHLVYLEKLNADGKLRFAGPMLGDDGKPLGSLLAYEAADRAEAEALAAGDPYAQAGLFASVEVHGWTWTFNAPEPK